MADLGGVGPSSWGSGLRAVWSGVHGGQRGHGGETSEHTGISRCWENGATQTISFSSISGHPSGPMMTSPLKTLAMALSCPAFHPST